MNNITLNHLNYLFSLTRILTYAQGSGTPFDTLHKYHLNIILSEAMLPSLHYLEVCLRNRIDQLFCKIYGKNWLMQPPNCLMISPEDRKRIEKISSNSTPFLVFNQYYWELRL